MLAKTFAFLLLASVSQAEQTFSIGSSSAATVSSATVQADVPEPPTVDTSKTRLDAQDAAGALADAEAALKNGGGADAYAARADAERALGRPMEEVDADYAESARLDPRYIKIYEGVLAEQKSEMSPRSSRLKTSGKEIKDRANVMANILVFALVSGLIALISLVMIRGRKPPV